MLYTTSPSVVPTQSTGKEGLLTPYITIGVNSLMVLLVVMTIFVVSAAVGLRRKSKHVITSLDKRKMKVGMSLEASHTFPLVRNNYYDIEEFNM